MTSIVIKWGCGVSKTIWSVAEAKAQFSEVIDRARTDGPQTITRNGHATVVIITVEEWERQTKRAGTLADFLAASPLRESGLDVTRPVDGPRDLDL
jgi:prevent-host-death family protein